MLSNNFLEVLDKDRSLFSLQQTTWDKIVMRYLLLISVFTWGFWFERGEPFLVFRVIGPQTNWNSPLYSEKLQEYLVDKVHIPDVTHVL
jgi:hypothetical protein